MFSKLKRFLKKNRITITVTTIALAILYWFCLPDPLFQDPVCTVVTDRNHQMLGARIADDGQWRFPHDSKVPEKFKQAIIHFEDKRFYSHPGVDPLAMFRAFKLNIQKFEVVSGGSTLSMQVIRMARKNKSRNIINKFIETIMATRLEIKYSKEEIMSLYASNAPFGGNVVGLDAASWKYFGRSADKLSWAETATLAVLPNSPGLIHPGRNRQSLKEKRNRLLEKLKETGVIDSLTCYLSKEEELPDRPLSLPDNAPHLAERVRKEILLNKQSSSEFQSTLDLQIQKYTNTIVQKHKQRLKENGIHNGAALVIDTETGNILAYIGNTQDSESKHDNSVDLITSKRSTGSILKPLLYGMMLNEGYILPNTLIADIPTYYGSYAPKNFDLDYEGAIPANVALSRSLNIPAARMLNQYGVEKFHKNLKSLGLTTLNGTPSHYGLSMILGGAETTLEDIASVYCGMARNLKNYKLNEGKYDAHCFRKLNFNQKITYQNKKENLKETSIIDAASIWHTFESMAEVIRPDAESNWQSFSSSEKIAWKTGTSFGFRDAWAIGCTPKYTVAVWIGNADGEGRPNLTGLNAAAPVMFEIFNGLNKNHTWFEKPEGNMIKINVCKKSGHRATDICTETEEQWVSQAGIKSSICPYHKLIHLDETGTWQVNGDCYSPMNMISRSYFVLPPAQEIYYKTKNPDYKALPEYKETCSLALKSKGSIELIYPTANNKIFVPVNLDGTSSQVIFQASNSHSSSIMYWHLDGQYLGETKVRHEIASNPTPGKHLLTLISEDGETLKQSFEVIGNGNEQN